MNKTENFDLSSAEVTEIKKLRQQLAEFNASEGTLEVVFKRPDGTSVSVLVTSKIKIRLLSKEIRNYLAEEQLLKQCRED
jgi:hypothetical protein